MRFGLVWQAISLASTRSLPMTFTPLPHQAPRSLAISRLVQAQGFDMLGIAPAQISDHGAFLEQWLGAGKHGEMDYLAANLSERLDPQKLVPGAKSILCVADRYPTKTPDALIAPAGVAQGKIARYAWRRDYHRDIKKRLHLLTDALRAQYPGNTFRAAVDTAPVLEREHAQRAGIGWIGKHTLLIHPQRGSFFLLGEIITTLPLQTSVEAGAKIMTNHCGACTRCIDACPTQCISAYSVDATRCISYLTLEHRTPIAPDLQVKMGDWLAGCDVCQEVCPFNQEPSPAAPAVAMPEPVVIAEVAEGEEPPPTPMPVFQPQVSFGLLEILQWTPQARQAALIGSALKRIKLEQFKRNALIAAGNLLTASGPAHPQAGALRERIEALASDVTEQPLVRQTASEVLTRLAR